MPRYKKQKDGRYRARVIVGHDAQGKPVSKYVSARTIKDLDAAIEEARQVYMYGPSRIDREILFRSYVDEWYEVYKKPHIAASNANTYKCILDAHLLPVFESRQLRSIRPAELQKMLNERAHMKDSYIKKIIMIMKQIFKTALSEGIIDRDPTARLVKPECGESVRRALTGAERAAVLAAIPSEPNGIWIALMYYLGLRPGEAIGLRWGDIDFKAHTVHIQRDIDYATDRAGQPDTLKNNGSNRYVPMPHELTDLLGARRGVPDAYVVQSPATGIWLSHWEQEQLWERLMRCVYDRDHKIEHQDARNSKAQKPERRIQRSVLTPYYLRHNYASMLHAKGVDVVQASKWLGHKTAVTTLKFYTHLTEEKERANVAIADGVFSSVANRLPDGEVKA